MRKNLSGLDIINTSCGPHPVGELIAVWCKRYTVKTLARKFSVQERTVTSWRAGNLPQMRHIIQMADAWGMSFLEDVFEPVLDQSEAPLEARLERIEQDIHHIRSKIASSGLVLGIAKKASIIIAAIAVVGTLAPSDVDMSRTARPSTGRTRRYD